MLSKDGFFSMRVKRKDTLVYKEYYHKGEVFVLGPFGTQYLIELRNLSPKRVMSVIEIDGLSIIDGKELLGSGMGYIIQPNSLVEIDYWRFGDNCPLLHFGQYPKKYVKIMDHPGNKGVVEANFYYENSGQTKQPGFTITRKTTNGWGGKVDIVINREMFSKEPSPISNIVLQYENRSALKKMGIENIPND